MKYTILISILLWGLCLEGQSWFARMYDPFGGQESAIAMSKIGDSIYIRANYLCLENENICSILGIFSASQNEFVSINQFEGIQGGSKNIMLTSDNILMSSQESDLNLNISLSLLDKTTFNFINAIELKIDSTEYFYYTISTSVLYFDKIILGAMALDSSIYVDYPGWFNYQEKSILFALNSKYELDTVIIIPPSSGAFIKIEDMAIGPDSILYVSFYEKYLKHGATEDYLEIRKVIYGFNSNFEKTFQWIGPDFDSQESLSCLAISSDTSIFVNYKKTYQSYLSSINPDGTVKWECLLDPSIGSNLYSIRRLIQTQNGDIVGVGVISSVIDELGESGFIFRVDSTGILKWKKAIRVNKGLDLRLPPGFPFQSGLEDVLEASNGDLIGTGYVRRYVGNEHAGGPYNFDIWMVRTNEDGCLWEDCPYIQDIVSKDQYMRLVNSENEWVVDVISPPWPTVINRYSFDPDSVLIRDAYYYELIYTSSVQGDWQETGRWMRQDNGKIYELDTSDSTDILLYDFDLQIGDTLQSSQVHTNSIKKVIGVTTTKRLKSNDRIQKILTIECTSDAAPSDTTVWIEGMGDVERLFWTKTYCAEEDSNVTVRNIRCFLSYQQVLYARPEMGDCYITAVEEPYQDVVRLYPNPTHDKLHFDVPEDQFINSISLFNSLGQIVLHAKLLWNNTLDVSTLPTGIYFGAIDFQNGSTRMFKCLIQ